MRNLRKGGGGFRASGIEGGFAQAVGKKVSLVNAIRVRQASLG